MRKTISTLTTIVAASTLTALGLALAPTAMAAAPSNTGATITSSTAEQRGHGGHGPRGVDRPGLETVMRVLDLTAGELKAARAAGTTLAELAEQQGVKVDALIAALVADAEERITDWVNGVQPAEGDRPAPGDRPDRGERGPGGHGGPGQHGPAGTDDGSAGDGS